MLGHIIDDRSNSTRFPQPKEKKQNKHRVVKRAARVGAAKNTNQPLLSRTHSPAEYAEKAKRSLSRLRSISAHTRQVQVKKFQRLAALLVEWCGAVSKA
jgi:hypothetical protein